MSATQDQWYNRSIFNLLLIALIVLIPATSRAAIQCYQCHGTPSGSDFRPIDAVSRNYSTGGFMGNHRSHMAVPASPDTCRKCHNNQDYTPNHRNDFINFSSNINSSPLKGKYIIGGSQITSKEQSATPVLGTCTDVNCHFEAVTPQWGAELFTAPADCDKCHGAPPSGGSTGASGSHPKHDQYYTGTVNCQKCHSNNTTFQHATSAGKRSLNISFAAAPNNGGGAYSGQLNDYLPSQNPSGTGGFGNCTAIYCHSPGNKASGFDPPAVVPAWGGAALTCKSCHKSDFASGSNMTSGSHGYHINWANATGYAQDIRCVKCHAVTANTNMTIADRLRHTNGQVEIAFNNTSSAANGSYGGTPATPASPMIKAPGSAKGQCTNVYCHSSGQSDNAGPPTYYTTPVWGTSDMAFCGKCHGVPYSHGSFGTVTPLTTGSHVKHLKYRMSDLNSEYDKCVACHAYNRTGYSTTSCNSGLCHGAGYQKHSNYEINVNIPDFFGASAVYNGTTKPGHDGAGYANSTCSLVYCHSNGLAASPTYVTPKWGDPSSAACGTCHGAKADSPPASTTHNKHVGNASQYQYACALCHVGIVKHNVDSSTYAVISTATTLQSNGSRLHVNKIRDVLFDTINPFGRYSSHNQSCNSTYCHSTGNTSIAVSRLPGVYNSKNYAKPKWTDGPLSCNSCHGRSTSNGMPDYANGKMGSMSSNSHPKHVTSSAIACVECHEKTTKAGTTIRSTFPSKHVNATNHDVFFNLSGLSPSGTYDNVQRKCSTTYCHGTAASLAWGGTPHCNSCHSANAGTTGGGGVNNWGATPVSAHRLHWEDTTSLPSKYANYSAGNLGSAGTYRFGCASCHNPASTAHVSGYASGSYRAQIFFGYTAPGKKPAYTYAGTAGTADNGFGWSNGNTTCTATYCHSNGNGEAGNTAVSWSTTANSATNTRCKSCHSYTTASGALIATNKHAKHANGATYSFSCAKCHNLTTTDGSAIADKTKHVNKNKDVAWDSLNSDGSAYVNTTTACANIYCHSQGTTFAQPYTGADKSPLTAVTWGGGQTLSCNSCHGNTNGYTVGTYRAATPLYVSGSPKGNVHQLHVDPRLGTDAGAQCLNCHNATTTNNTSIATYSNHVNEAYTISAGGTYKDGDNVGGAAVSVAAITYTYNAGGSSCSNVTCHPTGLTGSKAASATKWNDQYSCIDCHKVDMENNSGYHHAMRNYSGSAAAYPKTIPGTTAGANDISRRCTMCHVDHNTFSPILNASNTTYGSAGNLRMSIISSVTATKGYTNRDFFKTGSGGICISCHSNELFKDTGNIRVKNETSSTKTVAIVLDNYTGSAHEYAVSSTMKRDSKLFYSDCSKCHNGRKDEVTAFSSMTTATHDSDARRLYAGLGTTPTDGNDALFCYRCHSNAADAIGGTKKPLDGKDYYNAANMSAAAEDIFTVMQLGTAGDPGGTITTTNTLYFKPTTEYTPPGTLPTAHLPTGETFSGQTNSFLACGMSPYAPTDAYQSHDATGRTVSTGTTTWRRVSFISPTVATGFNTGTGNWTINIFDRESSANANARVRYSIYTIDATGALNNTIVTRANFGTEMGTTAAPGAQQVITVAGSNVAVEVGDRIVIDLEIQTLSVTIGGTYSMTYYWGSGANSNVVMPLSAMFNFTSPSTPASSRHDVANSDYAGKHKPSPTDETRDYIANNKHVSCNDCHDPHEAKSGNHTKANATLAKVLKGATGVGVTTWGANWAGVTAYNPATTTAPLISATAEWQICFKCHSGANANVTTWGGSGASAFTDLSLEFNPNNGSYHPVIQPLPAAYTDGTHSKRLNAGALAGGWAPGSVMTCSDCHSTDSSASQGPHGSTVKWMLNPNTTGTKYYNWPYTSAANNGLSTGTLVNGTGTGTVPTGNFCFSCHTWSGGGGAHTGCSSHAISCVGCHIRVPHGGKMVRLLTSPAAPGRYKPNGNGGGTTYMGSATQATGTGTIGMGNCGVTGGCTASEHPNNDQSFW